MSAPLVELGEFIMKGGGSVNPAKHPDEVFHLYSIPAYDSGRPDEVEGAEIGSNKNVVQGNDVLLSRIVPHIRRGWIVDAKDGHRQIASGEWIIFRSERFDPGYLRYHLLSDEFNRKLMRTIKGVGGSLMRADPNQVAKFKIPLPPLPTQRRIAAVLDKAQALVANDKRTLAVYDQLAKSLFLEMFGDPVRNERGWEVVTVREVGTARLGKMLDAKKRTGLNPRPYLRNTNVQWRRIELHDLHEMDFDEKDRKEFALKKGDILMCEGGEVGRCGIWKDELEECYFQKAIHRIRLDAKKITPEFFVRLFMELVERNGLKDYVTTSTISHLTGEKLATVRIPLPPLKDQLLFERSIEVIEVQRLKATTSLRRSEGLFGSLLQRAFAGELR